MKKFLILLISIFCIQKGMAQATPTYSPGTGTYAGTTSVTVSTTTSGASLFCTTNGSTPDISSSLFTSPHVFVVTSTQTISCVATIVGINQNNAQAQNPISSYWKSPPNCHCGGSFPACTGTSYNHPGNGCQADDPGGSGIPPAVTWSTGITSPSLSGNSMLFTETSQANQQTNILYALHASFGTCDACTQFLETHDYYWPTTSNSSSDEDDMYMFKPSSGIRYMAGGQYCHTGCPSSTAGWDFWGNSNIPWTYTGVTAGGTRGVWHHYQRYMFRIPAEETSRPCSSAGSWPYIYIKYLAIDNVQFSGTTFPVWKNCANALPSGWSGGAGMQAQIDIASHTTSVGGQQYWDNASFIATQPLSSVGTATYTIGTPVAVPQVGITGKGTFSGNGALIQ